MSAGKSSLDIVSMEYFCLPEIETSIFPPANALAKSFTNGWYTRNVSTPSFTDA